MQRINVILDQRTLDVLARLGQRFGIGDRSSVVRFIARRVAEQKRVMDITGTQVTLFSFNRAFIGAATEAMHQLASDLDAAGIEIVTATDDAFAVRLADAERTRAAAAALGLSLTEQSALVFQATDWVGDLPTGAFIDATGDGLILPLTEG